MCGLPAAVRAVAGSDAERLEDGRAEGVGATARFVQNTPTASALLELSPPIVDRRLVGGGPGDSGMGERMLMTAVLRPLPRLTMGAAGDAAEFGSAVADEVLEAVGVRHGLDPPRCQLA